MNYSYFRTLSNAQKQEVLATYLKNALPFLSSEVIQTIVTARVNLMDGTTKPLVKYQWSVHLETDLNSFKETITLANQGTEFIQRATEIKVVECGTWLVGGGEFGLAKRIKVVFSAAQNPVFKEEEVLATIHDEAAIQVVAIVTTDWDTHSQDETLTYCGFDLWIYYPYLNQ